MASHSVHPDIHEHGLADDCERCAEIAAEPWKYLDRDGLGRIVVLVTNPDTRFDFRTNNEGVAFAKVMTALEHSGALFASAPSTVERYLNERWGGGR
jgi:hypothetical protein